MNKISKSENSPMIRFDGFSEDWEEKVLKSMVEPISSYPLSRSFETAALTGYKYIHYGDIHRGRLKIIKEASLMPNIEVGNYQTLEQGDIVLADASEDLEGVAKACVIDSKLNSEIVAGLHTIALRPLDTNSVFLYYYFDTSALRKYSRFIATGTKVLGISSRNLIKHEGFFPQLLEQKAIGKLFQTIDQTLALKRQKYEKTKTLKKALLAKLFPQAGQKQPEMRLKGFSGDWVEMKLGDIVEITMGQSPESKYYTDNPKDYVLIQGNADMTEGKVVPRVWTSVITKTALKNDIIMSVRAPVGDIGKTDYDAVIGRGVASIRGNEFIYQLLKKIKLDGFWSSVSTGSTFESISSSDIKNARLTIPVDKGEQTAIANVLKKLDETITFQAKQIKTLENLKKALLAKMFV